VSLEKALSEEEQQRQQEVDDLRAALVRTQRSLLRAKTKTDHLVEATIEAARDAVLSQPRPKLPAKAKTALRAVLRPLCGI
jgi:hypothetical protein